MSFSVTGPFGPHNQHMGAARGRARHAVTKHRIVAKPSLNCPSTLRLRINAHRVPTRQCPWRALAPGPGLGLGLAPSSPKKVARNLGTLTFLRA